jgi:alginate O-acetyltransferase complex protein AlgJ
VRKHLVSGVVVAVALITMAWIYLFHDYISGNRWGWMKYKLGTFDSATVILGKKGLLFTKGSQDDIDDYRGLANPGNKVDRFRELFTKRNDVVRSLGGRFLYIIPPISETIYNEFLPRGYQKTGNRRRATLAMEGMRGSGVEMLYLAPALMAGKERGQVFYKFEPHWNRFGAYVGSEAVISYLSQSYPAMKYTLSRISEFDLVPGPLVKNMGNGDRNFGTQLGITLLELDPEPVPKAGWTARMETKTFGQYKADVFTKDDASLPSVVMFGDSFMAGMRKVMAENFRRAVFVNPWLTATRPLSPTFTDFPAEIIEAERPDIVIYDRWERAMLLSTSEWASIAELPPAR